MTQSATTARRARATWGPWSPLQFVAAALGGFLIVLGTLVLFQSGIGEWTAPETSVWGLAHTPLMAAIEIGLGFMFLSAVTNPYAARNALGGLGALMAVFGAIVLLEPGVFDDLLGVNRAMGLGYVGAGVGAMTLSALVPVIR